MIKDILQKDNVFVFLTVSVTLLVIITLFSTFSNESYTWFFNSDTLYLPAIYREIFIDNGDIDKLHFNPSPNFFPDMILYFLLMKLSSSFIVSSFLFTIIQYLFFLFLIFRLFRLLEVENYKIKASLASLMMLLFFFIVIASNNFVFSFYLIINSYHTSAFLMGILCFILSLEFLNTQKIAKLLWLGVILCLCLFSDRLIVVLYAVPFLGLSLVCFKKFDLKDLLKINTIIIFSLGVGFYMFYLFQKRYILDHPHAFLDFNNVIPSFLLLKDQMFNFFLEFELKSLVLSISIVSFLLLIVINIKNLFKVKSFKSIHAVLFFAFCYSVVVFFAPVVNGNYTGADTLRYNIYVIYLLVLLFFFILEQFFLKNHKFVFQIQYIMTILLICLSLFVSFRFYNHRNFKLFFSFYPSEVETLDCYLKENSLKYGLAPYWKAKYFTMFSRNNAHVYTANNGVNIDFHVMNEKRFTENTFNYIIVEREQDIEAIKLILSPIEVVQLESFMLCKTPDFTISKENFQIMPIKK